MTQMDPNALSPEQAERLKKVQELCEAALKVPGAKHFPDLTSWLGDEYIKYVEGRPYQKVFEPRRISPPGGYHSPRNIPSTLACLFANIGMERDLDLPVVQTEIQTCAIFYEIIQHKVPIYYVADSFIRAVAATELPKDFTLHDLHWPMPGMVLGFPVKFMKEYLGLDVCYAYCAEISAGEHLPPPALAAVPYARHCLKITTEAKVAVMFNGFQDGKMASWVSAYLKTDRVDEALTKYAYTDFTFADAATIAKDEQVTRQMSSLIFKLLVVLNTRPTLVEKGGIQRPEKRNKRTGEIENTELWAPNIIGAKYRVLRQPGTGTHATPKWHWRRGHLTHQRVGSHKSPDFVPISSLPRREDGEVDWLQAGEEKRQAFWRCHKRLWIEPTLVNFEESLGVRT